jgi:hypothetical protein
MLWTFSGSPGRGIVGQRGFILIPQVVQGDVLAQAARRIGEVAAAPTQHG